MNYSNKDCLFCRFIETKEKDNQKIYEDDLAYVILDSFPISRGHSLVIAKEHILNTSPGNSKIKQSLREVCTLVNHALKSSLKPEKIYVALLAEEDQHLNFNLIPEYSTNQKGLVHVLGSREKLEDCDDIVRDIRNYLTLK